MRLGSPPAECILVFLRQPVPGQVKTRLAATVGGEAAARTYARMTRAVLLTVEEWRRPQARKVALVTPPESVALLRPTTPPTLEVRPQAQGDLGQRLAKGFDVARAEGAGRVVAIGSDCPAVTAELLDRAFDALGHRDAVLGPAADGGYWLIGLARRIPEVFESIPWSSDRVFSVTCERLRAAGADPELLPVLHDIDTEADARAAGWL